MEEMHYYVRRKRQYPLALDRIDCLLGSRKATSDYFPELSLPLVGC